MKVVYLIECPESKACVDCKHAVLISDPKVNNPANICLITSDKHNGIICDDFEEENND